RGGALSGAYPTAGTSSTSRSPPRSRWAAASPTPGCSRRSAGSPTGTGSRTVTSAYPTRPASGWSSRPPWIPSGTSSSPNSPTSVAPRPRTLAAALLSTALVASVVGLAWRPAMLAAGALTWAAATLVVGRLSRRYRITVLLLAAAGLTAIAVGLLHGVPPDWTLVPAGNQPLISMLVAVTFVRLVAPRGGADQAAPTGKAAVWQTTAAVHAFGSVINITALDIVARRVFRSLPLSRPELMVLSRGYSSGAFWSPFWGAFAAVITYAPTANVPILMGTGAALAACALLLSNLQIVRAFGPGVEKFRGYPFTLSSLRLPATLIIAVLGLHALLPDVPVAGIIMLCAPTVTIALMTYRHPRRVVPRLAGHARRALPEMAGELAMFLSAGLITAGFGALMQVFG